jgi:hypothetical protein
MYTFLICPKYLTCPAQLIPLDSFTPIYGKVYKLLLLLLLLLLSSSSSLLCWLLQCTDVFVLCSRLCCALLC